MLHLIKKTVLLPANAYNPDANNIFSWPFAQCPIMANKVETIKMATLKMANKVDILEKYN